MANNDMTNCENCGRLVYTGNRSFFRLALGDFCCEKCRRAWAKLNPEDARAREKVHGWFLNASVVGFFAVLAVILMFLLTR
jgi:hypothetical protein